MRLPDFFKSLRTVNRYLILALAVSAVFIITLSVTDRTSGSNRVGAEPGAAGASSAAGPYAPEPTRLQTQDDRSGPKNTKSKKAKKKLTNIIATQQADIAKRRAAMQRELTKPVGQINAEKEKERVEEDSYEESDADLPPRLQRLRVPIDKDVYLQMRDEFINSLRGVDQSATRPFNPMLRTSAINILTAQIDRQNAIRNSLRDLNPAPDQLNAPTATVWSNLGPYNLPNGQTQQFPATAAVSGRVTAVVVDPTNSNKVYLGTAQGGVWRSLNGGTSWTSIFDAADTLSIGALALAPSDPTKLYVGTGEPNNSADCYFGVGVYRIDNVDTSATLVGPINPSITTGTTTAITYNVFTGRAISKILVSPTDPATIFVSTAAAVSSAAGNALSNTIPPLALRGVFRSTNATAAAGSVTFSKITVNTDGSLDAPGTGNTSIFDMVLDAGFDGVANQILLVSTSGTTTGGAIYRSTDALAATPTFTQTLFPGFNGLVMHLAINRVGGVATAYVTSNEACVPACSGGQSGRVRKSVDGGVTWGVPLTAAEGFCGGQCSYDSPVAVDPSDANIVYIGGNARGTKSDVLKKSTDGGTTFVRDDTGLHADSHTIFVDPVSSPHTVWFGNDGGIWARQETVAAGGAPAGTAWVNRNTGNLSTIQFVSIATHPTNKFLIIGGTQDNGTESQQVSQGNWTSAESGDGGFALIDQSATDTTNVTMYHTFFNQTSNLIGFDRTNLGACLAVKDSWEARGFNFGVDPTPSCDGTAFAATNGIVGTDTVLFYAPMALGPGTPNVLYFGTQRLYRSTDKGDTMVTVSQNPITASVAISAIGIAPANDNIRLVGMRNGTAFLTTTGASPLTSASFTSPTNATASATNKHISRAVIDPLNSNTAYLTLAYYTNPSTAGQIWRTTNLNGAPPIWTSIGNTGNGLPNVPVNGFAVDGADPTHPGVTVLYAGTDIGVYTSVDSGVSWTPYGTGLPRVAVFDMSIQQASRVLTVATHGRGMWQIGLPGAAPTTAMVTVSGRVGANGRGLARTAVMITGSDGISRAVLTSSLGFFSFDNVAAGQTYVMEVRSSRYSFEQKVVNVADSMSDVDFIANQ